MTDVFDGDGLLDDDDPEIAPIRKFLKREVDEAFLQRFGAHAAGIGQRRKRGHPRGELCLVLYVLPGTKRFEASSPGDVASPIRWTDPDTGQTVDIPTDIVEARVARMDGRGKKSLSTVAVLDPAPGPLEGIPGGVSCSITGSKTFPLNEATLGGWVWDRSDNSLVMLSNQHTLSDDESMVIFHPGPFESLATGKEKMRLGQVKRGTLTFEGRIAVDGAIGSIDEPARALLEVREIGPAVMALGRPRRGAEVEKTGWKTGHTLGRVDNVEWTGYMEDLSFNQRLFVDCISIESATDEPWSASGDSGSLVFATASSPDGSGIKPVLALHMGAIEFEGKRLGIACRIDLVFQALDLTTLPIGLFTNLVAELQTAVDATPRTAPTNGSDSQPSSPTSGSAVSSTAQNVPGSWSTQSAAAILAMRERLNQSQIGSSILEILNRHRADLVSILLRDKDLRSAAAAVLRPMFSGAASLEEVLERPVGAEASRAARRFADMLPHKPGNALTDAVEACLAALGDVGDEVTVREMLHMEVDDVA